jgi:hypothetical protein
MASDALLSENDAFMLEHDAQMAKVDAALAERETAEDLFIPKRCPNRRTKPEEAKEEETPVTDAEIMTAAEIVKSAFQNAGLVEIAPGVKLPKLAYTDKEGTIGIREDGSLGIRKDTFSGDKRVPGIDWLSDCILFITVETKAKEKTEFTIEGIGAKDRRHVKFTLTADEVGNSQSFKTALINAFGYANRFGKMNFEFLQDLTNKVGKAQVIQRIEVPCWYGNVPMIPGAVPRDDVQFKLSSLVPARVYDGDIEAAKDVLRDVLSSHKYAPIVIAVTLGAPAVARWRPDDRLAVALWGLTGTLKTTFAKHCMSIYGTEYESDRYLIKSGGGSPIALGIAMSYAGIMPVILDNVKSVDQRDLENYVKLVHMVIEGADRLRGTKDIKLQESLTFLCSLIVTGEIRPAEASTDARVLNLTWTKPDLGLLRQVEEDLDLMPVIGYHWLRFLAQTSDDMIDGFSEARAKYEKMFSEKGVINPGRLASIYTVLRFTWNLLLRSPLGDVFDEFSDDFVKALDEAVDVQGDIVNNDTEASKFLDALDGLLASQPRLFQGETTEGTLDKIIGKHCSDGLFLLPNETLSEMNKLNVFTQKPTPDSMTKALRSAGRLLKSPDKKHWQTERRINGRKVRGWLIVSPPSGDSKNDNMGASVSTVSTVSTKKHEKNFSEKLENFDEENKNHLDNSHLNSTENRNTKHLEDIGGDIGDSGDNKSIHIDSSVSTPSPLSPEPKKDTRAKCSGCGMLFAPEKLVEQDGKLFCKVCLDFDRKLKAEKVRRLRIQMVAPYNGHKPYEKLIVDEITALEWSRLEVCSIEGDA